MTDKPNRLSTDFNESDLMERCGRTFARVEFTHGAFGLRYRTLNMWLIVLNAASFNLYREYYGGGEYGYNGNIMNKAKIAEQLNETINYVTFQIECYLDAMEMNYLVEEQNPYKQRLLKRKYYEAKKRLLMFKAKEEFGEDITLNQFWTLTSKTYHLEPSDLDLFLWSLENLENIHDTLPEPKEYPTQGELLV